MSKRKMSDKNDKESSVRKSFWALGLKASMEDPTLKVYSDDEIVIIKDKYPKAKFHFLVLPKNSIANLKALTKDHVELLKYMRKKGEEIAQGCESKVEFRYGFHSIPSMSHLHLHVISQDFDSMCLKTKKHWNSFTTAHFVDFEDVCKELEENGKFVGISSAESAKLLNCDLRCHKCDEKFATMPKLKSHIVSHVPKDKRTK